MTIPTPPNWTKPQLTTLIHALALSPTDASSLLPYTQPQINNTIRTLSLLLHNPSSWTTPRHTRALLKQLTGLTPPSKPRRKKHPAAPSHRVSIQLIPATPADDAAVRAVGAYPFVEVVLKPGRRVWDIVRHLYSKWGLPVRVVHNTRHVAVDSLVVELLESGSRVVRVPYNVLKLNIDWSPLDAIFDRPPPVNTPGKKRIVAPRDDDAFWTGVFSPIKPAVDHHPTPAPRPCARVYAQPPGEQAVLSRLRGHLERLERQDGPNESGTPSPIAQQSQEQSQDDVDDFAVIPERFLGSCSRFDLAHSLPESLLSLGKSDESQDPVNDIPQGAGDIENCGRVEQTQEEEEDEEEEEGQVDVNALQVMNDALDLRHELDLRCDEDLQGMDLFRCGELGSVAPPSLSLSALFRD